MSEAETDEKPENESGEPPASGAVVVSLDLARVIPPKKTISKPAKKPAARPAIAAQLEAKKKRAKAEAARKAAKKARPGKGSSIRDALFKGFAQSLERASKQGEGFAQGAEGSSSGEADDERENEPE